MIDMETLDTLILSRIQFAANISFHILFPTITIALGWVLFFFRVRYAQTRDDKWMAAYRFCGVRSAGYSSRPNRADVGFRSCDVSGCDMANIH